MSLAALSAFRRLSPRLVTSGQPDEADFADVAREGIEVVVNLGLPDAPYALPDEAATVRALGMDYHALPVAWEAPTLDDLARFCALMDSLRERKVLVHCAANKHVSVFMALYRILREGWEKDAALAEIRAVWDPDATWAAFVRAALETPGQLPGREMPVSFLKRDTA